MQHIIHFAAKYPRRVLFLVLIVTGLAAFLLPRLEVRIAAEALMAEDDPLRAVHDRVLQTFGSSNAVVVVIRDPDLFTPENLSAVKTVVGTLKALPFTASTDSLFSIKHGELTEDEQLVFRPYLDPIPQTREAAEAVKTNAIANPFVARNLLSLDGDTMAIRVRLDALRDDSADDRRIVAEIERVVAPLRNNMDSVFALGLPQVRTALSDLIIADQATILPLSLTVLMVVLLVAFGRWEGMLLPLVTAVLSIIWTLAFMTLLGIPLNVLTSVAPMLLVVIGSTEDIHLVAAYIAAVNRGADRRPAIDAMAIASTSVALTLGFAVLTLSKFPPVVHFGALGALVILLAFLANFFITPILLSYLRLVTLWDLLDVRLRSQLVEKCMLFRGMGWFEVRQVIIMGNRKSFEPGDYVVRRGDESGELYVILDGEVQVQRHGAKGAAETSTRMQFGDVFGEVAMVANRQRHWDVVAVRKTEVLMLCWGDLQGLSRFMPRTYSRLLLNMASDFGQRLMSRRF